MRRQQIDGVNRFQRALAVRIEQAQAVNFVIKEVDTIGLIAAHWEQIQQRAARGVLAVLHHLIDMAIASLLQLITQRIAREFLPLLHHQRMSMQEAVRTDALHQRVDRHNQHAARQIGQLIKGGKTGRDNVLMRREAVVRQRFPVGEIGDRQIGELANLLLQTQGRLHIRRNHQHRTRVAFGNTGALNRLSGANQFAELTMIARFRRQGITTLFRHKDSTFSPWIPGRHHSIIRPQDHLSRCYFSSPFILRTVAALAASANPGHLLDCCV